MTVNFRCEPVSVPRLANTFPLRRDTLDALCRRMLKLDAAERRIWLRVHRETLARDLAWSRRRPALKRGRKL